MRGPSSEKSFKRRKPTNHESNADDVHPHAVHRSTSFCFEMQWGDVRRTRNVWTFLMRFKLVWKSSPASSLEKDEKHGISLGEPSPSKGLLNEPSGMGWD